MNKRKRLFSKRKIVVLSVILLAAIVTTGLVHVRPVRTIALLAYVGLIEPIFQHPFQKRRLLCSTDHQALLEECRRLSAQIVEQDPNIRGEYGGRAVRDSELSDFPTIRKVGGIVLVDGNGGATVKMGDTFRHFGVDALSKDYEERHPDRTCGDCELVPGLWYYDDLYHRHENYDKTVERLLRKNKARKKRRGK